MHVDECAPHHFTSKVPWHELHGGSQVVSGLVALLNRVICKEHRTQGHSMEVNIFLGICVALQLKHGQGNIHTICGHHTLPV